ncbi:response regulator transcription factor [Vagococcus sp. BWB3-3]|uniref:Response regulator transcription factor n=1 Tax=Vagococcus allomyrinae TaxID=2794353 RepID=A0A940SUF1_9ENTE|nr:LytTR family DNA-binding domain-containing protein [Vagococcus allomyrinae]MBP1040001.1 response regulator transcription factor [Vagococcus allomyrinae]
MLQIAICDADHHARRDLRQLIDLTLQLKGVPYIIREESSGESLLQTATSLHFDIIFLDIKMRALNGIETAKIIRKKSQMSLIIFVTSHAEYVFQAFDVKAFNFIVKPYADGKMIHVLNEALRELKIPQNHYLPIKRKQGIYRLSLADISYFYSHQRQVTAVTAEGETCFYDKLDQVEKQLPDFFIRCHNRYIVNLNMVTNVSAVSLDCNGETLPISRKYKHHVALIMSQKGVN